MPEPLFEVVPNISEGKDCSKIERFARAIELGGASLLDYSADVDHNRSVYTLVGTQDQLKLSLLNLCEQVLERVDMRKHQGVHPCLGALDVLPFVPLKNATLAQAKEFAEQMAALLWEKFSLPSFFYDYQSIKNTLANLRKKGFAGLSESILEVGDKPHPTAGAVAISARHLMIAFNVNLLGANLSLAKKIARRLRYSSGGMLGVKALGLYLPEQKKVQVSMNLIDYQKTSPRMVYDKIAELVQDLGVGLESEVIGLMPSDALSEADYVAMGLIKNKVKIIETLNRD